MPIVRTNLEIPRVQGLIKELDESGQPDVLHLVSVGGWNGPHLDSGLTAIEWFETFQRELGPTFDGIDWDLEGHDRIDSPTNFFTTDCLEKIGVVSQLAKAGRFCSGGPHPLVSRCVVHPNPPVMDTFSWIYCHGSTTSVVS